MERFPELKPKDFNHKVLAKYINDLVDRVHSLESKVDSLLLEDAPVDSELEKELDQAIDAEAEKLEEESEVVVLGTKKGKKKG